MKLWKKIKRAGGLLLAAAICTVWYGSASMALEPLDFDRTGSISVQLTDSSAEPARPISGAQILLYRVADARLEAANLRFELLEPYRGAGISLDHLSGASEALAEAVQLNAYITAASLPMDRSMITGQDGGSEFAGLSAGMYLIVSQDHEGYEVSNPFLVGLPMMAADGSGWNYDIMVSPKAEAIDGAVILNKINTAREPLSGAEFTLQRLDDTGNWQEFAGGLVTDGNGQIIRVGLPYGSYRFLEQKAPGGYVLDRTPYEFTVTVSGEIAVLEGRYEPVSGKVPVLTVVNRRRDQSEHNTDPDSPGVPDKPAIQIVPGLNIPLGGLTGNPEDIDTVLGQETPFGHLPQTGQDIRKVMFFFMTGMGLMIYGVAERYRGRKGKMDGKK